MRKNELQKASAFSIAYFVINVIYSYLMIYQEPPKWVINIFLFLLIILNIIIFLYLKKFLKYYYNVKDRSNTIYTIIVLESLINLMLICCYGKFDPFSTVYFALVIVFAILTAVLLGFYMSLASKLLRISKKSTRLMIPFAYSFYVIPLIIFANYFYSLLNGQDLIEAFEIHDSSLIFTFLKAFPFLLLTVLYYRAWLKKKNRHQHA